MDFRTSATVYELQASDCGPFVVGMQNEPAKQPIANDPRRERTARPGGDEARAPGTQSALHTPLAEVAAVVAWHLIRVFLNLCVVIIDER